MCRRCPQTVDCGSNRLRYAAHVGQGELVALKCRRQTLEALASGLIGSGSAAGPPDWLVSGVWLDAGQARYLATASVEVLSDGFVARPLSIATPPGMCPPTPHGRSQCCGPASVGG